MEHKQQKSSLEDLQEGQLRKLILWIERGEISKAWYF